MDIRKISVAAHSMSLTLFTPGSTGLHTSDGRHHYEAWHGNARHARRLENFVIHPPYELLRYASSTRLCKWRLSTFDVRLPKPLSVVCLVYYSALMLGTDHRGTPSKRGAVSSRLGYAHRPRGLLRHEARPRAAKKNHLQLGGQRFRMALAAAFKLDGKTSSMEALACTVPAAHGMDTASNERARSEKLRSRFSV